MNSHLRVNDINEVVATIRQTLSSAYKEISDWDTREPESDEADSAKYFVERAFVETLTFLEAAGLDQTFNAVAELNKQARKNYSEYHCHPEGTYLVWSARLEPYLKSLETSFGGEKSGRIVKDLIDILRATLYSITDRNCFQQVPQSEDDVHSRVEAVLRCVFPDLLHKPTISKPIKNFEPDTGIPSLKTLIEYKHIQSKSEAKLVVDQVLADTRGYSSPRWNTFIYVIYETFRLKPEIEWRQMLRANGVPENTDIIVLCGEAVNLGVPPGSSRKRQKTTELERKKRPGRSVS